VYITHSFATKIILILVQLAYVKHIASVNPEPGSNSFFNFQKLNKYTLKVFFITFIFILEFFNRRSLIY